MWRNGGQHFCCGGRLRCARHRGEQCGPRVRLVLKEQLIDAGTRESENLLRVRVAGGTVSDEGNAREQRAQSRYGSRGWSALQIVGFDQHADQPCSTICRARFERDDGVHDLDGGASA